ncbi:MAG: hypothetical protein KIT60_06100 [Burkholderiaceae bacterium]|nr:hypothetical protein [Burkholderiaceae bacterium]
MSQAATLRRFDVCNGDADGLCAVLQWRLHDPAPATLVTGLKREIDLLRHVPCGEADEVLVCDLSVARNREPLRRLLDAGTRVRYFDHHIAADVPIHDKLEAHLDADPQTCSSLLVDRWLGGRFHAWALVGAFGDALTALAQRRAAATGYDVERRNALQRLGEAINYNAYGEDLHDVRIAPADLYRIMARHPDPLEMIARESIVQELDTLRRADLQRALALQPLLNHERARVCVLPDEPWSRRVSGSLANELAAAAPRQAQAVLTTRPDGGYRVSVRAPRALPHGADVLCKTFGGGGRAAAAGVDALPADQLNHFVASFGAMPWEAWLPAEHA